MFSLCLRDIKAAMRGKVVCAGAVCCAAIMLLAVAIFFVICLADGLAPGYFSSAFCTLAVVQTLVVWFVTPAVANGALGGEKSRRTLDGLIMSAMHPAAIAAGKLMYVLVCVVLVMLAGLPAFCALSFYGVVSPVSLLALYGFDLSLAAAVAAFCMMVSVFRKSGGIMSYLVIILSAVVQFIVLLCVAVADAWGSGFSSDLVVKCFLSLNPVLGVLSVMDARMGRSIVYTAMFGCYAGGGFLETLPLWAMGLPLNLLLAALFFTLASIRLAKN